MGPSFLEWVKPGPKDRSIVWSYDPNQQLDYYGSGKVPVLFPGKLAGYCYACPPKREYVPKDVEVMARDEVWEPGMCKWPNNVPRGGSAGSMCLGLTWLDSHQHVALIGFDGFGMPDYFISEFRGLLKYWRTRGMVFYTLMPESVFDDLLEKPNELA